MTIDALEAESAVCGSILLDDACLPEVLEHLTEADFVLEANRAIFRAAVELYRREEPVDPVSIRAEARGAVSDAYMLELMQATNTAANAGIYAEETRRASMRRSLVALGQELEQRASTLEETPRLTYWCDNWHGGGKWFVAIDAEGREDYGPHVDRLAAYEETGLEPGEIEQLKGEVFGLRLDKQELEQYRALGPIDRLRELAQTDKDGKIKAYIVDSFYCDICQKRHDRIKEIKVYLTRDAAEAALSERR